MYYLNSLIICLIFIEWPLGFCKKDKEHFKDFEKAALDAHNKYRKQHQADKICLTAQLNSKARQCAKHYAKLGQNDHSCPHRELEPGKKLGENLYEAEVKNKTEPEIMKEATDFWYAEVSNYNFKKGAAMKEGDEYRHFTQMVWKAVKELGVALEKKGTKVFVTALYNPMGNEKKKYQENVHDKIK